MALKYLAVFFMLNLALFAFVPANAATCPALNACIGIAGLLNVQFGSQSSSQCCSLLGGLVEANAAVCLCTNLKNTVQGPGGLGSLLGPITGLLGPLLGPLSSLPLDQQVSAVFNACGLTTPTTMTCA